MQYNKKVIVKVCIPFNLAIVIRKLSRLEERRPCFSKTFWL